MYRIYTEAWPLESSQNIAYNFTILTCSWNCLFIWLLLHGTIREELGRDQKLAFTGSLTGAKGERHLRKVQLPLGNIGKKTLHLENDIWSSLGNANRTYPDGGRQWTMVCLSTYFCSHTSRTKHGRKWRISHF